MRTSRLVTGRGLLGLGAACLITLLGYLLSSCATAGTQNQTGNRSHSERAKVLFDRPDASWRDIEDGVAECRAGVDAGEFDAYCVYFVLAYEVVVGDDRCFTIMDTLCNAMSDANKKLEFMKLLSVKIVKLYVMQEGHRANDISEADFNRALNLHIERIGRLWEVCGVSVPQ